MKICEFGASVEIELACYLFDKEALEKALAKQDAKISFKFIEERKLATKELIDSFNFLISLKCKSHNIVLLQQECNHVLKLNKFLDTLTKLEKELLEKSQTSKLRISCKKS